MWLLKKYITLMNLENSKNQNKILDDGFGNAWVKCQEFGDECGLQIVRPGKTQCWCNYRVEYIGEEFFEKPDLKKIGWTGNGWYFWDETLANCYGPYKTREEAKTHLYKYSKQLK